MSERWLVAMSGGVDSSVAAALISGDGREAIGVTLDLGYGPTAETPQDAHGCCGIPDVEDARAVARKLGIRHYTLNCRGAFREAVVDSFVRDYLAGRTPVPCIACNRVLKFEGLLRRADALDAAGVATGHYARVAPGPGGAPALFRPRDRVKDQTYFLFDVPPACLDRIAFPLGDLDKEQVREIARSYGLRTASKPESQGICFVPDGDVRSALARRCPDLPRCSGPILDRSGRELGRHPGALGYTRGQRHGLGLSGGPWFVVEVRPEANELVVDRRDSLMTRSFEVDGLIAWDGEALERELRVQVRHRQPSVAARVEPRGENRARIHCGEPVWAPAPGQAAVFYEGGDERLVGGGWIAAVA